MQNDTTTLDQRIARRQRDATESERIPSVVKHILIALACFAAAFICGFVLSALENGGIAPRIVWPFVWLGGKYWVPPLPVIPGLFNLYLACWFLTRKSNIDG